MGRRVVAFICLEAIVLCVRCLQSKPHKANNNYDVTVQARAILSNGKRKRKNHFTLLNWSAGPEALPNCYVNRFINVYRSEYTDFCVLTNSRIRKWICTFFYRSFMLCCSQIVHAILAAKKLHQRLLYCKSCIISFHVNCISFALITYARAHPYNFAVWLLNGCNKAYWLCVFDRTLQPKTIHWTTLSEYCVFGSVWSHRALMPIPIKFIRLLSLHHWSPHTFWIILWIWASDMQKWNSLFNNTLFFLLGRIFNFKENFKLNVFFENGILNTFHLQLPIGQTQTRAFIEFRRKRE